MHFSGNINAAIYSKNFTNKCSVICIITNFTFKYFTILYCTGYGYTSISDDDEDFFMHSTEEKAQFLADFLEAIDVTKKCVSHFRLYSNSHIRVCIKL